MYTVVYGECKHFFKSSQVLEKEKVVAKHKEKANLLSKSKMDPKSMERAILSHNAYLKVWLDRKRKCISAVEVVADMAERRSKDIMVNREGDSREPF